MILDGTARIDLRRQRERADPASRGGSGGSLAKADCAGWPGSLGRQKDFSIGFAKPATKNANDSNDWLYVETVAPLFELWIAGSGHVAQAVAPLALQLEFAVTVFDDRPDLANHEFFPAGTQLRVGGWHELLKESPKAPAFGLIVTRGHQHDALVLTEWIHQPFIFLGMIGSSRKARIIREKFLRQNIASAEALERVACPVGADILAQSTQEIGVSIMAQYIQKRANYNHAK